MPREQTPLIPELLPFKGENIPQFLKDQKRWAPWKAVWKADKQKYDKVPCRLDGYGLSTAQVERWYSYELALSALGDSPGAFAGLGFNITGCKDLVALDLDKCITDHQIAPWAQEVIDGAASYTEISPSGNGLRTFVLGTVSQDWQNHDVGLEVYAGNRPRFLTVSGQRLKQSGADVRPVEPTLMASMAAQYRKSKPSADIVTLHQPDMVDELALPDLSDLELPYAVADFLAEGTCKGDRSALLHSTGIALYASGLTDSEVFSILVDNPHAMEVALDHRNQDTDKAMSYLWVEHCQKAKPKAASQMVSADDFEVIAPADSAFSVDDFDDISGQSQVAPLRDKFQFDEPDVFADAKPVEWIVKKVLPKGEVGVLYGSSGAGKSFFTLDLVLSIARGVEWRGHRVKQGTVAYICAEGAGGFRLRLKAYAEFNGVPLKGLPLRILGEAPNFMDKADIKELVKSLKKIAGLDLIVVDTWAQVTAGANENSGEDMGRALGHCKVLHQTTGAMVLLVAHSGKDESRGMRGWSGVKGALDVEICVERSGEYRSATVKKVKDGEGEGDEFAFTLDTVVLGQDEDGDNITSCVVKQSTKVAKTDRKADPVGAIQQIVLRVARDLTDLDGAPTTSQLIAAAVNQLPRDESKKEDSRRSRITRAVEAMVSAKRLSTDGGTVNVL